MEQRSILIKHTNGSVDVTLASDAFGFADIDAFVSKLRLSAETSPNGRISCCTVAYFRALEHDFIITNKITHVEIK